MKKLNIWLGCLVLFTGTLQAQEDSIKVKRDSTVIERKTVIYDSTTQTTPQRTVNPTPTPTPAPAPAPKEEEKIPLRCGEIGARVFPTATYLSFNTYNGNTVQGTADINWGYGLMLGANFTRNIGIVGEVDYLGINQKYKDQELERQVQLNYLNIPVMLSLNTDKTRPVNLNLVAGPQFGINVGSSVSATGNGNTTQVNATVAAKGGDVGIAYGAGLEFALNHQHTFRLDLGFRGMYGFVDISGTNTSPDAYTVTISGARQAYGGYAGLAFMW